MPTPNGLFEGAPSNKIHDQEWVLDNSAAERSTIFIIFVRMNLDQSFVVESGASLTLSTKSSGDVVEGFYFDVLGVRGKELDGDQLPIAKPERLTN